MKDMRKRRPSVLTVSGEWNVFLQYERSFTQQWTVTMAPQGKSYQGYYMLLPYSTGMEMFLPAAPVWDFS